MAAVDDGVTLQRHARVTSRIRLRLTSSGAPLAWVLGLVLALLVVPPIVMLVRGSFAVTRLDGSLVRWTLHYYEAILADPDLLVSLRNSLIFAGCSSLVALCIGGTLAWIVERTNAPLKAMAYAFTVVSMGMPFVLFVASWLFLLGPVGPLNDLYKLVSGSSSNLFDVHSLGGMIIVEGFHWAPLSFLLLASTFRAANAEMEEAARMSGATVLGTIRRISLPLAMPAILALLLLAFIRTLEAFEVPALIGIPGRVQVLTTEIYHSTMRIPPDRGYSSAFSVILLVIVAILLSFYGRLSRRAERFHSITGKGFRPRPLDLGRLRPVAGAFIVGTFVVLVVLPLGALFWMALMPFPQGINWRGWGLMTLGNFLSVINDSSYLHFSLNTLLVSAGCATATMVLVLLAGWIAARRGPGWRFIDQIVTIPLIFPGIVLGVAVMQIFLRIPLPIYGTLWVLLIAYVIKFLPFGMRYVVTGVLQVHRELEEAAAVSGASVITTVRKIVVPLISPAVIAGWLFIFLIATRELAIAILLTNRHSQVLAVTLYDLWEGGRDGELASLGLLWTAFMTAVALGFFLWARRHSGDAFSH